VTEAHAKLSIATRSPGPALYTSDSTLGRNVDNIQTLPQWQFGTADRFGKMSKDVVKFPGPGGSAENPLEAKSSLGNQVASAQSSQPIYGMGTSTRDSVQKVFLSDRHSTSQFAGVGSPGPAKYEMKSSFGKQDTSAQETPPSWVFGSNERFRDPDLERAKKLPGPDYSFVEAFGNQMSSKKRTAPLPSFGTSTREHAAKVFLTPGHEKVHFGKASPGPLTYSLQPGVGHQTLSSKREAPSFGFGTNDRWYTRKMAMRHGNTPAPGAYNV